MILFWLSATCSHFLINAVVFNRQRSNNVLRRKIIYIQNTRGSYNMLRRKTNLYPAQGRPYNVYAWRVKPIIIRPKRRTIQYVRLACKTNYNPAKTEDHTICTRAWYIRSIRCAGSNTKQWTVIYSLVTVKSNLALYLI